MFLVFFQGMSMPIAHVEESWQMAEFYSNKVFLMPVRILLICLRYKGVRASDLPDNFSNLYDILAFKKCHFYFEINCIGVVSC